QLLGATAQQVAPTGATVSVRRRDRYICQAWTSLNLSTRRNAGNSFIHVATTTSVPMPPTTTAGTVPNQAAVVPDSNSPNSFEAPMNSIETADTRPRMKSGVASWIRVLRIFTLTMSVAPSRNRQNSDKGNQVERPKPMVARPKAATTANMRPP